MTIKINHNTTIRQVQKKFSLNFPYLKIEFADKRHEEGAPTTKAHWYDPAFELLAIAKRPQAGALIIQPWHKTGYVEELFSHRFGLYPQIFRKEHDEWIQTAGTDVFTLDEQNEIGRKTVEKDAGNYWIRKEILL